MPTANELYRADVKRSGRHGTVLWSLFVFCAGRSYTSENLVETKPKHALLTRVNS